jgi:hypothetical protein
MTDFTLLRPTLANDQQRSRSESESMQARSEYPAEEKGGELAEPICQHI